ncbi:MAG TPA: phosphatase PAP2 family protein [Caulobacteraceae bacterium]
MTRRLILCACAATSLFMTASALGQTAPAAKPQKTLEYLTAADIDPARLLAAPPVDGSPIAQADLAETRRIAAGATPERLAQAKWDDEHENPSAFDATLGKDFDLRALPATAEVLRIAKLDGDLAAGAAKKFFARKRPWAVDSAIQTCDPNDKPVGSYPSGHATMGYTVAMTYAALIPEKAQALMARADDYAYSREVCGSHYGSDTRASAVISAVVVTTLLKNPEFQAKMEAARTELRAAKITAQ